LTGKGHPATERPAGIEYAKSASKETID
jgi:hypothetical protein